MNHLQPPDSAGPLSDQARFDPSHRSDNFIRESFDQTHVFGASLQIAAVHLWRVADQSIGCAEGAKSS
jgi:hypothetical protein